MNYIHPNDPAYTKTVEPSYKESEILTEFQDDYYLWFPVLIVVCYYSYNGTKHVVKYTYEPKDIFHMSNESLDEDVRNAICENLGRPVSFECNGQLINKH